jgi:hypothetical protein
MKNKTNNKIMSLIRSRLIKSLEKIGFLMQDSLRIPGAKRSFLVLVEDAGNLQYAELSPHVFHSYVSFPDKFQSHFKE